ncbi:MAG: ferric iron uptake transcriptional regulator [Neisseriaceae bacterium]|nr:ferric iron uptake transcriptional regulator [Neisseriaceae bacterium]MBR1819069.1 ferric iron uptake transcriptional regulator [Neisseriaceae bacterium]
MSHKEQIRSLGMKVTGPRLKILSLFEENPERHLSAEDVYRITLEHDMNIGVATVYRVLAQFEEAGILVRHQFDKNKAVYELDRGIHHDHLVCVRCGKITEFCDTRIEKLQEDVAEEHGYEIIDHAMYLYGTCTECQKSNKKQRHI